MHTIDLEPFQYSGTNITGIRLIDPESPIMEQVSNYISESQLAAGEEVLEGKLQPDSTEDFHFSRSVL